MFQFICTFGLIGSFCVAMLEASNIIKAGSGIILVCALINCFVCTLEVTALVRRYRTFGDYVALLYASLFATLFLCSAIVILYV